MNAVLAAGERLGRRADDWQQRHRVPAFICAVVRTFNDDQAGNLAALLAYYAFFATFPLLLVLVSGCSASSGWRRRRSLTDADKAYRTATARVEARTRTERVDTDFS